jgi:hypothetical protein
LNAKEFFQRHGRALACAALLIGPLMQTIFENQFTMPVLWSGIFIGLSVCSYGLNRPCLGVTFGLAAVFFRELALPYCVLCAAIAWQQGQKKELAAWIFGLIAWALFFALHWWRVSAYITPNSLGHRQNWFRFLGVGFIICTAQMNAYLMKLPQWISAIYLVAAMVGLGGWSTPLGTRVGLTICLYAVAFSIVGQSFNQYWGSLYAPLLCFGVARFPASLRDLLRAAKLPKRRLKEGGLGARD